MTPEIAAGLGWAVQTHVHGEEMEKHNVTQKKLNTECKRAIRVTVINPMKANDSEESDNEVWAPSDPYNLNQLSIPLNALGCHFALAYAAQIHAEKLLIGWKKGAVFNMNSISLELTIHCCNPQSTINVQGGEGPSEAAKLTETEKMLARVRRIREKRKEPKEPKPVKKRKSQQFPRLPSLGEGPSAPSPSAAKGEVLSSLQNPQY